MSHNWSTMNLPKKHFINDAISNTLSDIYRLKATEVLTDVDRDSFCIDRQGDEELAAELGIVLESGQEGTAMPQKSNVASIENVRPI